MRGPTGVGKTTFALTTLLRTPGRRVYVSCRTDLRRRREHFPGIAEAAYRIEGVEL